MQEKLWISTLRMSVTIIDVKEKYAKLHVNGYRNYERVKRIIRMADDAENAKLTRHPGNIRSSWLTITRFMQTQPIEISNILFGRNCSVKLAPPNRDEKFMKEWGKELNELWEKYRPNDLWNKIVLRISDQFQIEIQLHYMTLFLFLFL